MIRLEKEESTEEVEEVADEAESKVILVSAPSDSSDDLKIRKCMLYGDINEQVTKEFIATMILLSETAETEELEDPEDLESEIKTVIKPFEVIISTGGGNADEMMSIYDMMRMIRQNVDIETIGVGKVMSAGTLLLAAGTKGKRRIGRNCRVMIHAVTGGSIGPMHELTNEFKEIQKIQDAYINCLADETNMTVRQIKKYLKQKTNVYLTAEEAVELGLADEIF